VHIEKENQLIGRLDLDRTTGIEGSPRTLSGLKIIEELKNEGRL
jgi:hypothetical protein